jgi:hypothetical protein
MLVLLVAVIVYSPDTRRAKFAIGLATMASGGARSGFVSCLSSSTALQPETTEITKRAN